jgi:hypothetical protein
MPDHGKEDNWHTLIRIDHAVALRYLIFHRHVTDSDFAIDAAGVAQQNYYQP